MRLLIGDREKVFSAFLIFGLVNNILYVVILSAAIDLVGHSTPKAIVLLADIAPALIIKLLSPLFIHLISYGWRIFTLVAFSCLGMILISVSPIDHVMLKVVGIGMASLSSGIGEVSFLQLTHHYHEPLSIGGFSMGTGAAGILGSFIFMLLTNILAISTRTALILFALVPLVFPIAFYFLLPKPLNDGFYDILPGEELSQESFDDEWSWDRTNSLVDNLKVSKSHILRTLERIKPLVYPYMIPLCSVYVAEYTINQGISPTMLFPLDEVPQWLVSTHRDTYVLYGFFYQFGVFVSRSSSTFGVRYKQLYILSWLQIFNVVLALCESMFSAPFTNLWLLLLFAFYEGLLGGLLYVNTFLSVSEQVSKSQREFSMGSVGISDSFGIMIAGVISWFLEPHLCQFQVRHGKNWCQEPSS